MIGDCFCRGHLSRSQRTIKDGSGIWTTPWHCMVIHDSWLARISYLLFYWLTSWFRRDYSLCTLWRRTLRDRSGWWRIIGLHFAHWWLYHVASHYISGCIKIHGRDLLKRMLTSYRTSIIHISFWRFLNRWLNWRGHCSATADCNSALGSTGVNGLECKFERARASCFFGTLWDFLGD